VSVVPTDLPSSKHSSTVNLFGHKVSADALLIAGASVVAILVLYRMQKGSAGSASTIGAAQPSISDLTGNGLALAPTPINLSSASSPPGAAANPIWTALTRGDVPGAMGAIPIESTTQVTSSASQVGSFQEGQQITLLDQAPIQGIWPGLGPQSYYEVGLPGGGIGYVLAKDLNNITSN
jgi:hypothetical protein